MGHVGHKGTLLQTRLIGALCLFLQPLLFLYQVGHITNHTIVPQELSVFVKVGHRVDHVPLQLITIVEDGLHVMQVGRRLAISAVHILEFLDDLIPVFHKQLGKLVKCDDGGRHRHTLIDGEGAILDGSAPETHVAGIHQIL